MATRASKSAETAAKPVAMRGRPPRKVFVNVLVRESTRSKMKSLTKRHGLTQGELLDQLVAGKLSVG